MISYCLKVGSMTRGAQISRGQPRDRAPPFSSSSDKAPASRINEPFRAPRNDKRLAPSTTADDLQNPIECIEIRHCDEVAYHKLEDEDYDPEADEDGVRKEARMSVKEAIALPPTTKILLPFNKELQPIGQAIRLFSGFLGSLGADYSNFSICEESWKHVNKAKKEHAYDIIKDTRHNLYHKYYKETSTFEKNLEHRLSRIEENEWKWFFEYRQKEETKISLSIFYYFHKNIHEKEQGRPVGRRELFIITHKKKIARIFIPMRMLLDESSKHLSQNDSLAQVLGKEHPRRVRALGAGPCPTQVFGNAAGQPSGSGEQNEKYERRIAELTAKIEEEQAKR
ncbi:hypothetical protein Ahy_A08g040183 [Arachis hypogaea]|uniref:Uncharacterized protein n=1 Tax=Arachis hypogaea TaxID=3818 RepID=A0A445BYH0_ARAHY|nr:hypothetical protein Ahy_A08g040183 [Arachis hypogaea]